MLSLHEWLAEGLASAGLSLRFWQDSADQQLGNFVRVLRKAYTKAQASSSSGVKLGMSHNHVHGVHYRACTGMFVHPPFVAAHSGL